MARTRVTAAQKKAARPAATEDYEKMAVLASEVVLENRGRQYRDKSNVSVFFIFPHWIRFDESFPKGHIVAKTDVTNTHKINAVKLLDWLYSKGFCSYDTSMLVSSTTDFEREFRKLDKLFDIGEL